MIKYVFASLMIWVVVFINNLNGVNAVDPFGRQQYIEEGELCNKEIGYIRNMDGSYSYKKNNIRDTCFFDDHYAPMGNCKIIKSCSETNLGNGVLIGNILINTNGIFSDGYYQIRWIEFFSQLLPWGILLLVLNFLLYKIVRLFHGKISIIINKDSLRWLLYGFHGIIMTLVLGYSVYQIIPDIFAGCATRTYYIIIPNIFVIICMLYYFSGIEIWLLRNSQNNTPLYPSRYILGLLIIGGFLFQKISETYSNPILLFLVWSLLGIYLIGKYLYKTWRLFPFLSVLNKISFIILLLGLVSSFIVHSYSTCG